MSRTTRKRRYPFEWMMDVCLEGETNPKIIGRYKAHWTNKDYGNTLPKYFRKMVNKNRRRKDTRVLYKEINMIPHKEEWYSKFNCKDNQAWDYW